MILDHFRRPLAGDPSDGGAAGRFSLILLSAAASVVGKVSAAAEEAAATSWSD